MKHGETPARAKHYSSEMHAHHHHNVEKTQLKRRMDKKTVSADFIRAKTELGIATLHAAMSTVSNHMNSEEGIKYPIRAEGYVPTLHGSQEEQWREHIYAIANGYAFFPDVQSLSDAITQWMLISVPESGVGFRLAWVGSIFKKQRKTEGIEYLKALRPETFELLKGIGQDFYDQFGTELLITSLVRTEDYMPGLLRTNRNASPISSHMYGTAFDIAISAMLRAQKTWLTRYLENMDQTYQAQVTLEKTCFHIGAIQGTHKTELATPDISPSTPIDVPSVPTEITLRWPLMSSKQ